MEKGLTLNIDGQGRPIIKAKTGGNIKAKTGSMRKGHLCQEQEEQHAEGATMWTP
jgi:hypothetical protein